MDIVEWNRPGQRRHPWELARFEILYGLFAAAVPPGPGEKLVVDMGCGDGWFAEKLLQRRSDIRIIGVDPAYSGSGLEDRLTAMDERFFIVRTMEAAVALTDGSAAAAILLFDVIEHIEADRDFLTALRQAPFFSGDTTLLVSVPAYPSLFTAHDVFLQHYRRYTARSLQEVLVRAGLVPAKTAYFFAALLPLRWWEKQKEKRGRTKVQEGIGNWKGGPLATHIIRTALLLDFRLSKILAMAGLRLPGLSLYSICKKRA